MPAASPSARPSTPTRARTDGCPLPRRTSRDLSRATPRRWGGACASRELLLAGEVVLAIGPHHVEGGEAAADPLHLLGLALQLGVLLQLRLQRVERALESIE